MRGIKTLWRGEYQLSYAFWAWAVIGGLLVNMTASFILLIILSIDQLIPALIFGYGISIPYNVVVLFGVWRSAARYDGPEIYANLARGATAIMMTGLSMI
jgi:hypothetical protein